VVEPTQLKNMLLKLDHETPSFGMNIKKIVETTAWIYDDVFGIGLSLSDIELPWLLTTSAIREELGRFHQMRR